MVQYRCRVHTDAVNTAGSETKCDSVFVIQLIPIRYRGACFAGLSFWWEMPLTAHRFSIATLAFMLDALSVNDEASCLDLCPVLFGCFPNTASLCLLSFPLR